jgi:C4-dicarboxylate-specific signal transduction histidine kinase
VPKQESADGRFEDPGDAKLALTGGLPRLYSAIGELVGSYCHDISNALAVSAGYLDLARNGLGGDRALETAAQGNVAAIERIRMLHGFVRTLYRQSTDAADLIGQAEIPSMVQEMFDNTFVQGQLHVSTAGLATEQLPKVLLGALLYPPLHNSAEATGDRERRGVAVTLGLNDQRSALQVLIEDDGPGWPKKPDVILRSIVADQPFSTKGQGRGNGLRNVYRLVSTLGGGLQIGRSSGGGATVDIRVPLRGLTNVN